MYMQYCLSLASRGAGHVAPNPMVGAVVVVEDRIIGEGWHQQFGGAHAEVNALNAVKPEDLFLLPQATLFVTLEPCNHFGKTPPCTEKIISSGIKKVVIGSLDPNPLVAGKGVERLKENGIAVTTHVLENKCRELNKYFFCYHEKKRPYITLKWAQSADGFIAGEGGKPIHFTNAASDQIVHKLRAENMSILIGGNTAITDNPRLTTRLWPGKNPTRIILDTKNNLPSDAHIFNDEAPTLIFNFLENKTVNQHTYIQIPSTNYLPELLTHLHHLQINSVLVEGGTKTLQQFIDARLYDEIIYFESKQPIQKGIKGPIAEGSFTTTELEGVWVHAE
jgi:diaminohydroxyphosphoribosylaminopyrimidine deaminase/5-amino-6-(5-phosphoribosylamino)uracil reductase